MAILEQLAEESAELAQAALKVSRILRGENPTPVDIHIANMNMIEELTDVYVCAEALNISPDMGLGKLKSIRWAQRIAGNGDA